MSSLLSSVGAWTFRTLSHTHYLSIMYDILSLTHYSLLTADDSLIHEKNNLYLIHDSHSPFHRKRYTCLLVQCHLCPICTLTKPNLHFDSSFATVTSNCPIHLTCYIPNLMSIFCSFRSFTQRICPGLMLFLTFHELISYELLAPLQAPKLEDRSLSAVCNCLFNIFTATWGHVVTGDPPNVDEVL
jgi:hypothetical protein